MKYDDFNKVKILSRPSGQFKSRTVGFLYVQNVQKFIK